jgi:DNA-binding Lrp family transcriptional regulator
MTFLALAWAMTAPVADVYERAILIRIASRARDDGLAPPISFEDLADVAVCDIATVEERITALVARGVLTRDGAGFELGIPAEWFSSAQLQAINKARVEAGQSAITAKERPWIPKP